MKKLVIISLFLFSGFFLTHLEAQKKVYQTTSGETIFSFGNLQYTDAYKTAHPGSEILSQPVRFSMFIHIEQNTNYDITKNVGFFSGVGLRNIGVISDENLPEFGKAKIIRRAYTLGVPLGIKLGSLADNFFIYGGGEYEWAFHVKEKYWNSYNRDGVKTKHSKWFSNQVNPFLPSLFVGIQFPKGYNLKFKYYLTDFLNSNYRSSNEISDLGRYKESSLMYIALTMKLKTSEVVNTKKRDEIAQY